MQKKSKLLSIVIIFLLIILVVIATAIFSSSAFRDSRIYRFISGIFHRGNVQMTVKVLESKIKGAADYGYSRDTIIIAQEEGVYGMNLKGDWLWDRKINLNKPVVKTAGNYFVVADLEGQAVLLFKDNSFLWQKDFSHGVINVDLTDDGVVTVVHGEKGYTAAVSVMNVSGDSDGKGTVKFTRKISDNYIISAVSSGKQVCISGFSTTGGNINATINFLKMSDGQSFSSKTIEGQIFTLTFYIKDSLLVLNSDMIVKYDIVETSNAGNDNRKILWEGSGSNQLLAANTLTDRYLIIATGSGNNGIFSTNGESAVIVYNSDDKVVSEFKVNGTVKKIYASEKNTFAVCTDNEVYIYDVHGNLLYKHGTISTVEKVCFINDKETIVFSKKDIHIITEEVAKNESDTD